jgi:DNA-binding transcriptional LysR family regulator
VRYDQRLAQDMIAILLGPPQRYAVVASPEFIAAHGRPKQPKELLGHPCLRTRFESGAQLDWEFEKAGRVVKVSPSGPLLSTHSTLQVKAAIDGLGFVMTFEGYIGAAIQSGALVSVRDDWCAPFPGPFLHYPSRRQLSARSSRNGASARREAARASEFTTSFRPAQTHSMLGSTRSGGL